METAIALIAFFIITTLVMPNLLSKEIILGLVVLGIIAIAQPTLLNREQVIALVAFGILFSLIIPELMKGK
ncbi:hypothetical protein H6F96_11715 [Microcoleus sp. FACHB-53]|jgi:hypothetical protein|uniref:Uncharacterized protein n=1 Tax=Allocoleopsis franciscana PCC 7113 TaxID=1173027 RepID=K9W7I9_9CYAN|nr:hypothetical protein [Allocoleopsis franciscana]AFZ16178.1 hypothetical protein Mic7113_0248 [Allocoleopsis franciscana PCC 7113]MBD2014633.1 hypothetical protein [Microcoleus sp. FACHB-53]MBD2125977.1 hypothetical protein [Microcoleus sp. FACHB-1]